MVQFDRIALVPPSLYVLVAAALGVAAVAWWWLGLTMLQGYQLLAGLEGAAFMASAVGSHPDVAAWQKLQRPNSAMRRLWWRTAYTANFGGVVYYRVPLYVGLALLAAAAVMAVWPAAR
jgi:hypothetical protein